MQTTIQRFLNSEYAIKIMSEMKQASKSELNRYGNYEKGTNMHKMQKKSNDEVFKLAEMSNSIDDIYSRSIKDAQYKMTGKKYISQFEFFKAVDSSNRNIIKIINKFMDDSFKNLLKEYYKGLRATNDSESPRKTICCIYDLLNCYMSREFLSDQEIRTDLLDRAVEYDGWGVDANAISSFKYSKLGFLKR